MCGARTRPLPATAAAGISALRATAGEHAAASGAHTPTDPRPAADLPTTAGLPPAVAAQPWWGQLTLPSPRAAAILIMGTLAFGVLVGSAVSPVGSTQATPALVVAVSAPGHPSVQAASAAAPPAAAPAGPAGPGGASPSSATPATIYVNDATTGASGPSGPSGPTGVSGTGLPPVSHVFLIVLSGHSYDQAFGAGSAAPYLAKTLTGQGELLANYYAVTQGSLANELALISGQGPTPQTAANCPDYTELSPGTIADQGQATGAGCVYPQQAGTLADQLAAKDKSWRAYVEGIDAGAAAACRHPPLGGHDPSHDPGGADGYVTWRDPFVYFHSIIDAPTCAHDVVGLGQLASDIQSPAAPAFAYIAPDRCHDGSDAACASGAPAGLAAADTFLQDIVPQIESSAAYKDHGLIAITFDQAPQSGPGADASACCDTPAYPNLPAGGRGAGATGATGGAGPGTSSTSDTGGGTVSATGGGGRVGLLLISSSVKPGSVNQTDYYNHFSLLRSIENLFGLDPLGYAAAPTLPAFDSTVYNAATPVSSTAP